MIPIGSNAGAYRLSPLRLASLKSLLVGARCSGRSERSGSRPDGIICVIPKSALPLPASPGWSGRGEEREHETNRFEWS